MIKRSGQWISRLTVLLVIGTCLVASAADQPKSKKKKTSGPTAASAPVTSTTKDPESSKPDTPQTDDPAARKEDEADRKVDFSGIWTWTFTNPNNGFVHEPTLKIKQQGSRIAGQIKGRNGMVVPVRDVRITKESNVAFTLDREFYGYPMEVKFIGKLQKDTISGKMGVFINGNSRIFDWTARRVREGAPNPNDPSSMPASTIPTATSPGAPKL